MTTALIRKHLRNFAAGQIITSAQLLAYGRRNTVDKALSRLVKAGHLLRIVRGQFMMPPLPEDAPTVVQVIAAKATRFGKQIVEHASKTAHLLKFSARLDDHPTYAVCGASQSSFKFGSETIVMQGSCARKTIALTDSKVDRIIKALWYLGKDRATRKIMDRIVDGLQAQDRMLLKRSAHKMPSWLWDRFGAWSW